MTSVTKFSLHQCPDCPPLAPKFESNSTLLHHIQEAHPFPKRFRCDDCGKGYARSWSLSSHRRGCVRPAIPDFDTFSLHSSVFSSSEDERFCASPVSERSFSLIDDVISSKNARERLILEPPRSRRRSRRSSKCSADASQSPGITCDVLSVNCLDLNRLQVMSKDHNLSLSTSMKKVHRNLENLVSAEIRNKMALNIGSLRTMRSARKGDEKESPESPLKTSPGSGTSGSSDSDHADEKKQNKDSTEKTENHEWIAAIIASWIEELCLAIILRRALLIALLLLCLYILEQLVPNTFKYNNILGAISGQAVVHMSYLVPICIAVLWGVCWMFAGIYDAGGVTSTDSKFEAAFEEFTCGEDYYPERASRSHLESDIAELISPDLFYASPPSRDFTLFSTTDGSLPDEEMVAETRARSQLMTGIVPALDFLSPSEGMVATAASTPSMDCSPSNTPESAENTSPSYSSTTSQGSHSSPILEDGNSKAFKCDICGATFSHKTSMNRHKRNKHQDAEQECPVPGCTKVMREDNLKRHVENTHPVSYHDYEHLFTKAKKRRATMSL